MNVEPNNKPTVIKVGGSTLEDTGTTFQDIATRTKNGEQIVVVHGGGPEASQWLKKMDIESRFENGLRVTDEKVLPVVTAVYAGLINKRLVEALNNEGVQAVGLSGLDGEIITSNINNQALGYVGEPNQVNPKLLRTLFESGYTAVISPISFAITNGQRKTVNVNADSIASILAIALEAKKLLFLTDTDGVSDSNQERIPIISEDASLDLIANGIISGGMIPKVQACLAVVREGVQAQIVDGQRAGILLNLADQGTSFEIKSG